MLPYLLLILLIDAKVTAVNHAVSAHSTPSTKVAAGAPSAAQPSFFSAYSPEAEKGETQVTVHCKLLRGINNLEERITIVGVVQEDLVSSTGKIIIAAGSKVIGQGFCDPQRDRILGRDRWTFYVSDHLIRVAATLFDSLDSEGLRGAEDPDLNQPGTRQAIYRDGAYVSLPAGSDFLLRVKGSVSIEELGSAFEGELPGR